MLRAALIFLLFLTPAHVAGAQVFPVDIEHKYGTTTVMDYPERVVSLSYIGHDFLLALGVKPIALRPWYGGHPHGVWPWAQEALGDHEPEQLWGEIDVERIATLEPDLIVGLWSGMTADDYRLLSQIAPTVAPQAVHGDYGTPWQVMTQTLGDATGQGALAAQIVADLETRFETIRTDHPEWRGMTSSVVWAGQIGAYTRGDIRSRFMRDLGFDNAPLVDALGQPSDFYVLISPEDLTPIDTDVLLWIDAGTSLQDLKDIRLRPWMNAHQEGREIYVEPLLSGAISHSSPLSLNYALDQLVPLLEQAADGDPQTIVESIANVGLLSQEVTP